MPKKPLNKSGAAAEAAKRANMISKTGALARIPIIGPAIAGGSMGYDIADLIERYEKGDTSGAVIQGIGALGSGLAMIPHPYDTRRWNDYGRRRRTRCNAQRLP